MKRWRHVLGTSLVVGLFGLFSARTYGAEGPLEKILVGVPEVSALQSPLFVAIEAGAFKKYGMEVSVVRLPGAQAIQALVAGSTQFAQGVSSRTVPSSVLAGADTVMIAGITNKFIFTMHSPPQIDSVASLKGKIVGVSGIGASIDFATRVALKHFGLKPDSDVAIRAIGGGPEIVSALKAGIIQAGTLSPPSSFRAEKMGFKRLFDMGTLDIEYISGGLGVKRSYMATNRGRVENFLKGMIEGIKIFKTDKNFTIPVLAKYTKLTDSELLEKSYAYFRDYFIQVPYPSIRAIKDTLDGLADQIPKAKGARPEDFIDLSLLREIEASGFVEKLYSK